MPTTLSYVALGTAIFLGILGQIALKSASEGAPSFTAQLFNPMTLLGLAFYGCGAIAYIAALNRIPLTIAFPSVAVSYAIVAVLAHFLWNEPLGLAQIGGIVLIGAGVILIHQT